ncbi:ribonucleotide-diphosphate reductase subunit alpha [compost metagenome]
MDQLVLVEAVAALQKFVDTGISAEYILDRNIPTNNAKKLFDIIMHAWRTKTKAVYYIRSIKPGETWNGKAEEACAGCAG